MILRGAIRVTQKPTRVYISLFLLTKFGPIYYGPPRWASPRDTAGNEAMTRSPHYCIIAARKKCRKFGKKSSPIHNDPYSSPVCQKKKAAQYYFLQAVRTDPPPPGLYIT